MIKDS
jgi:hypothetical protein